MMTSAHGLLRRADAAGPPPAVAAPAAVSLAAAAAFAAVERRSRHPMLPLELFRSRQFASATALALVTYAALGGVIFLFVAFLQISRDYTALITPSPRPCWPAWTRATPGSPRPSTTRSPASAR